MFDILIEKGLKRRIIIKNTWKLIYLQLNKQLID